MSDENKTGRVVGFVGEGQPIDDGSGEMYQRPTEGELAEQQQRETSEAFKRFNDALQYATNKIESKFSSRRLPPDTKIVDVKAATAKARKGGKLVLVSKDKDGMEHKTVVTDRMLQFIFSGALLECLEQSFEAVDVMGERQAAGVPNSKVIQAASTIITQNVAKAIASLDGESKLSTVQRHALAFLKVVAQKLEAFDGMSSEEQEVQEGILKVMYEYLCAFHHVIHPATKPKARLKIINDYREGRNASFMKAVDAPSPIPAAHESIFGKQPQGFIEEPAVVGQEVPTEQRN